MRIHAVASILFALALVTGAGVAQSSRPPGDDPNPLLQKQEKPDVSRLRDLHGSVKDEAGNAIDGAIIQLKNDKSGEIVDFRTKADGAFLFYDLNMDNDYELKVSRDGFEGPVVKKLSKYDDRRPATLNFELQRKKPA